MAEIAAAFEAARSEGRAALMPYMMGGFPDAETSAAVAGAYADAGADLVELGIPYSDPLADGPVIHAAGTRALDAGATLESVLADCERIASRLPVIAMAYANMIWARGPEAFARLLADAGAAGAIVPDLPPEEGGAVANALRDAGLAIVPLVAPTTPPERRARICAGAEGFVYVVSDTRTTGERDDAASAARRVDRGHQGRLAGARGRGLRHRNARAGGGGRRDRGRGDRRHAAGARGGRGGRSGCGRDRGERVHRRGAIPHGERVDSRPCDSSFSPSSACS